MATALSFLFNMTCVASKITFWYLNQLVIIIDDIFNQSHHLIRILRPLNVISKRLKRPVIFLLSVESTEDQPRTLSFSIIFNSERSELFLGLNLLKLHLNICHLIKVLLLGKDSYNRPH